MCELDLHCSMILIVFDIPRFDLCKTCNNKVITVTTTHTDTTQSDPCMLFCFAGNMKNYYTGNHDEICKKCYFSAFYRNLNNLKDIHLG